MKKCIYSLIFLPLFVYATIIGDTVWNDENKNWEQDANEQGIPNVTIELYDRENNLLKTTTTDTNGNYEFRNVLDNQQFVKVVPLENLSAITPISIEVWTDADMDTINFGLAVDTYSIGDKVWNDIDEDWEEESNEVGLANVTIELYDDSNQKIQTVKSDSNGEYTFDNIRTGEYSVKVITPTNAKLITQERLELWVESNRTEIDFGLHQENNITVKRKLLPPANDKIYFSAFPGFGSSEDIVNSQSINNFETLATKKLVWAPFSQHWFKGMAYPKAQIQAIHEAGVMPYVRFLPRSDLKQFEKEKVFTLDRIINGDFDTELRAWAKGAKAHDIPFIMDFGVEMNGDWFSWSGIFNGADKKDAYGDPTLYDGPEKYRDAYRHIIDLFRDEEVNHVTWFFHPNILDTPTVEWNKAKYYYPGDDYIDWIGFSLYGPFFPADYYWDTFPEIVEENYKRILEISSTKPFALSELGVTDHHPLGTKKKWLDDAFALMFSKKFLNFRAFTYWHEDWDNDGSLTALKIDSSDEALSAFRAGVQNEKVTSKKNMSGN